jgi:hypothetical protein
MNVATLWIIYVVVVIILWLILWLPCFRIELDPILAAFVALVVGALLVFVLSPMLDMTTLTAGNKSALSALFIVAYILPIILLIWVLLAGYFTIQHCQKSLGFGTYCERERERQMARNCGNEYRNGEVICDPDTGECVETGRLYD